ncbi:hypothetical protein NCCNTM_18680 [Mycolicibacterium sp. NCC-Tsukiji]|nr:hypothetical protein NCCNTM_18680 [Mycolicibacterium sp. NCC-Tsukiji]
MEKFDEGMRAARLLDAQDKAAELFVAIDERGLIRPGVGERQVTDEIHDLAAESSASRGTGTSGSCMAARTRWRPRGTTRPTG